MVIKLRRCKRFDRKLLHKMYDNCIIPYLAQNRFLRLLIERTQALKIMRCCCMMRSFGSVSETLPKFSVIHVSTHIPLADALSTLNQTRIERVIQLAEDAMKKIVGRSPRIAVAGINPHAGENGLFGRQEIDIIQPAIENM